MIDFLLVLLDTEKKIIFIELPKLLWTVMWCHQRDFHILWRRLFPEAVELAHFHLKPCHQLSPNSQRNYVYELVTFFFRFASIFFQRPIFSVMLLWNCFLKPVSNYAAMKPAFEWIFSMWKYLFVLISGRCSSFSSSQISIWCSRNCVWNWIHINYLYTI